MEPMGGSGANDSAAQEPAARAGRRREARRGETREGKGLKARVRGEGWLWLEADRLRRRRA